MKDRRDKLRVLGSSELCSDALLYHKTQAAQLSATLLTMRCGVKVLREEAKAESKQNEAKA